MPRAHPGGPCPQAEPADEGLLDVGDGHRLHWEVHGPRGGKPAVVLHGGPGSGASPWWARPFDPQAYRVVLFDQRGCGRSRPHASTPSADLSANTTHHLVGDIERLRKHLGIARWLVLGGSWGSTLGLAYAQAHPGAVSELVLHSVVTTTRREVRWVTHDVGRLFPAEWQRFRDAVPASERGDLTAAYHRRLLDPDPAVHEPAARDWCRWEDAHVRLGPATRRTRATTTRPSRASHPPLRGPALSRGRLGSGRATAPRRPRAPSGRTRRGCRRGRPCGTRGSRSPSR